MHKSEWFVPASLIELYHYYFHYQNNIYYDDTWFLLRIDALIVLNILGGLQPFLGEWNLIWTKETAATLVVLTKEAITMTGGTFVQFSLLGMVENQE